MKGSIFNFIPFAEWAIEFLFARTPPFWVVTATLAGSLVASILWQRPFAREVWKRTYGFAILQFLFWPATIAIAAMGAVDWTASHFTGVNRLGLYATDALFGLSLVIGVYWTLRMKGLRWFAGSLALLQLWMLYAAGFIAAMALTGTWL